MKLLNYVVVCAMGLSVLPCASQAATFKAPKNYSVVIVDGQKTESYFSNTKEIELKPGQHQIVVKFKGSFRNGGDSLVASGSNPIVINIPKTKDSDNFSFTYRRISDYQDAVNFTDNQVITITNNGEAISKETASYFILKSEKGFQLDRDFAAELQSLNLLYISEENNQKIQKTEQNLSNCRDSNYVNCPNQVTAPIANAVTSTKESATTVTAAATVATAPVVAATESASNVATTPKANQTTNTQVNQQMLDGLKSIYNSADPETRKAFKAWVNAQ